MFRDVPECSGMFRHVPECSMFRVLSTAYLNSKKEKELLKIGKRKNLRPIWDLNP